MAVDSIAAEHARRPVLRQLVVDGLDAFGSPPLPSEEGIPVGLVSGEGGDALVGLGEVAGSAGEHLVGEGQSLLGSGVCHSTGGSDPPQRAEAPELLPGGVELMVGLRQRVLRRGPRIDGPM